MIWLVSFGLSAGFIAAGAVCFFIRRKQGKNEVRYLGAGVFLASVTACYPVMRLSEHAGFAAAMSVSQGIRMFVVDTGVSDILKDLKILKLKQWQVLLQANSEQENILKKKG